MIETELKQRISTLEIVEALYLLKGFSQANIGSLEGFYKVIEKHIGRNS